MEKVAPVKRLKCRFLFMFSLLISKQAMFLVNYSPTMYFPCNATVWCCCAIAEY